MSFPADPCLTVIPPCMNEADRFSLEALRHIHKQLDDDNDGGIEVNESVEVRICHLDLCLLSSCLSFNTIIHLFE